MTAETHLKRDSPPGSVEGYHDDRYHNHFQSNGIKRGSNGGGSGFYSDESTEEPKEPTTMKKNTLPSTTTTTTTTQHFSSKSELDAGLESMFAVVDPAMNNSQDTNELKEDLELVRHLTEPLNAKQLEVAERKKSKKKGKKKRGASLERMIATLVLKSSEPEQRQVNRMTEAEFPKAESLSTKDILSDLVKSCDASVSCHGTASVSAHSSKETTRRMNTSRSRATLASASDSIPEERVEALSTSPKSSTPKQLESKPAKVDGFGFATDDDWTAFDDFAPFDTSLFPTQALDENGFPIPVENKSLPIPDNNTVKEMEQDIEDDDFDEDEEDELAAELSREMANELAQKKKKKKKKVKFL